MAYEQLDYEVEEVELPDEVTAFIEEADRRYDDYQDAGLHKRYPKYVPSEPAQVYSALKYVKDQDLPLGERFIEWGSGFGVATGLAALLGYEATGIELQEDLVDKATDLLAHQGIEAEFIACSYIPDGFAEYESLGSTDLVRDDYGGDYTDAPRYEGMDIDLEEVDLFFMYPWPGEQEMALKLFDALAGEGAILVAYLGDKEINLYRKLDD